MSDTTYLDWPFFEDRHRALARELDAWATANIPHDHGADVDAECRALVQAAGRGRLAAPRGGRHGLRRRGRRDRHALDLPAARDAGPALGPGRLRVRDAGPGLGPISLAGTAAAEGTLPAARGRGEAIAAFALSEPDAGSDVAAMACSARIDGDHAVLDGEKTWISNGGIADFYVVFVRSGEAPGRARHQRLHRRRRHTGLRDRRAHRRHRAAPAGPAALHNCRVPLTQRVGARR
jgi:acyl-CoA dehydrogenase